MAKPSSDLIPYGDAIAQMLNCARKPQSKPLPLMDAIGSVALCDITSPIQVPSFRNSAMDGFAVCASALAKASEASPVTLPIAASIAAGDDVSASNAGVAVQIMTGARVPEPFDTVVPVEMAAHNEGTVTFIRPASRGDHIRQAGEDVESGQRVVTAGEAITPERVMLLSALGIQEVAVAGLPRIHLMSTGNEITDDYAVPLTGSQIYNSNAPYLVASARHQGLDVVYEGIVRDDPVLFECKISAIEEPAIIISTGAVSKGTWDFIPDSLQKMGATIHFHRVNIRPGKPIIFATLPNGSYYFGLPGNPISAAVGFTFFVMPLVRALQGMPALNPLVARLNNDFTKRGDFHQFLKAMVTVDATGQILASIADGQESFKIRPMAQSNAWVVLEGSKIGWKAGEVVPVVLYGALHGHPTAKETSLCQAA